MANFSKIFLTETKYGEMAALAAPIIIFASVCIAWSYARARAKRPVLHRSMSIGALHGGKLALQRLIDYNKARADATILDGAENELIHRLKKDYLNFQKLNKTVTKLEMSGKEADAVKLLKDEVEKAKKENKPHEAYEIEMLLVEMLIFKGNFKKALKLNCLGHEEISDVRRPLYKAILFTMSNEEGEAKKCWENLKDIRRDFLWEPSLQEDKLDKVLTNFDEFKTVVKTQLAKRCY